MSADSIPAVDLPTRDTPGRSNTRRRNIAAHVATRLEGRQFVMRGAERYALNLSLMFNLCLFVLVLWLTVYGWRAYSSLAARLHGGVVFVVSPQGTTAHQASEFQTGPLEMEVRGLAWEVVTLIVGADSSEERKASANFARARSRMTADLAEQFDREILPTAMPTERAEIVKLIKSEEANVTLAKDGELPEGRSLETPGYHVIVRGRISAFRRGGSQEALMAGAFAYYVHIVPSTEGRTVTNPTSLLVAAMIPVSTAEEKRVPNENPST